ncbi:UDP-N-acetylmuramoyl-tripeptide--D-alanyl-D-alanine ligase [Roseovarius sp. A21]|uniref:UDP-N-acetylmuramoyl-tripeptide--D-alanyl-D-alanine ligase n=1 Tax=Roseovarius bejariae TaxID=2576383 RepID=A0A844D1T5_9RHOB|nr:UDP-N-acetylmuramoyl-tripeptide--D-alanyl-D-alanine ligase [Roseovarius bejariae]MRU16770.1 UDP-N-acetylmuramoyl-tripeptide--D-alanyl-D-alanine ligase [Roseovarius bejariae]
MTLWTSQDAAKATDGHVTRDWQAAGVSIDTRTIEPGDLFVALKAARDGHDFVAQALEKGAAAALVSHIPEGVAEDAPLLIVDDVLTGLEAMGRAARARTQARVVAVTGSVGKTSTKEMLRDVLSQQGRTHAAEASYNNHWGVPLTLARMPADTEFAVIEIGMNHPGEIAPLSRMARPHVAMITTVAAAHLEAFEDLNGIAIEKSAIFDGLEDNGTCIFNGDLDSDLVRTMEGAAWASGGPVARFGACEECQYRLMDVRLSDETTVVQADLPGGPQLFKISTPGRHFAMNGLATLAAVEALGADPVRAAMDLARWHPPAGRGTREVIALDHDDEDLTFDLIDDAFNANPTSMAASLEVLAASTPRDGVGRVAKGRRVAILGDMLELGEDEIQLHAALSDLPYVAALDVVHCVGSRMAALYEALPEPLRGEHVDSAEALADKAHRLVDAGDVVLVKGSKGSHVSRVVDALRRVGRETVEEKRNT